MKNFIASLVYFLKFIYRGDLQMVIEDLALLREDYVQLQTAVELERAELASFVDNLTKQIKALADSVVVLEGKVSAFEQIDLTEDIAKLKATIGVVSNLTEELSVTPSI